jgi:hypothetical protein
VLSDAACPSPAMPRTCECKLTAVEQPYHLIKALPAPPLQHLGRGKHWFSNYRQ